MAECLTPFILQEGQYAGSPVACGKCPNCASRRTSQWSFRMVQEDKASFYSSFITLTYDTANVPITPNGYMSLRRRDLQLFFKRLRKAAAREARIEGVNPPRIRYYAIGEYGGRTSRPHFHIILFNCPDRLIQPAWGLGHVHYGTVTEASCGYTLKYISKAPLRKNHSRDDREPEKALMSKGLGRGYLNQKQMEWHKADLLNRMYVTTSDRKKVSMPRYYKEKIYEEDERNLVGAHQRKVMLQKQGAQQDNSLSALEQKNARILAAFENTKYRANQGNTL